MGCSDSKLAKQRAEEEFLAEQRAARQAVGRKPGTECDDGAPIETTKPSHASVCTAPRPLELPAAADERLSPRGETTPTLPGATVESLTPRSKSLKAASSVGGASLNVGAVFRAALEDQCAVTLTADTLPLIVEIILKALDKDANGSIELTDLKKFIQTVCKEAEMEVPPDEQISEVFQQLDIDRNGSISRAELAAVMFRWFIVGVC